MAESRESVRGADELVYVPRPSWAPLVFAFGAALALVGIFANGFMLSSWIYSLVGVVLLLAALRSMVRGAVRDHYRLPRRQQARGAVLPVEPVDLPRD